MWGGISAGLTNIVKPGTFCFAAGTKVAAESGKKNIEDIQVGDRVLSYNEATGEQEYKRVVRLFRNQSKEWTGITVKGEEVVSTPGHKYYLPESKSWLSAKELKTGDKVLLSNGALSEVEAVRAIHYEESKTTYNFEVEDFHTYYVGDGVLVHNKACDLEWAKERRSYWKGQGKSLQGKVGQRSSSGAYDITKDNLKRMASGRAPLGIDGKSVNLHHMFGREGANFYKYTEVTKTFHYSNFKLLHPWIFGG